MVAPVLLPGLDLYWGAFAELSSVRATGFAQGAIPWTAMDAYARRYGILDADDFALFTFYLRAMDAEWLDHARAKQDRAERA